MAEIFTFLEATIKAVGSTGTDTTETAMTYCEGVSVQLSREQVQRRDSGGALKDVVTQSKSAQMNIDKLYGTAHSFFDGNDVKLYLLEGLAGSEVWTLSNAWMESETWNGQVSGVMTYKVTLNGDNFSKA